MKHLIKSLVVTAVVLASVSPTNATYHIGHGKSTAIAVWDLDGMPKLGTGIRDNEFYIVTDMYYEGTLVHAYAPSINNGRSVIARTISNSATRRNYGTHDMMVYLGCYKSCRLNVTPIQPGIVLSK